MIGKKTTESRVARKSRDHLLDAIESLAHVPAEERLSLLLRMCVDDAAEIGLRDLATVLTALAHAASRAIHSATVASELTFALERSAKGARVEEEPPGFSSPFLRRLNAPLAWLTTRGGPLSAARAYNNREASETCTPTTLELARRMSSAKALAAFRADRATESEIREAAFAAMCLLDDANASDLFGAPLNGYRVAFERIRDKCLKVSERSNRSSKDYLSAVLQGWGLSATRAKDVLKQL